MKLAALYQSPAVAWMTASAATAAVSARRIRGPSGIAVTKGRACNCARSASENPPSGPMMTPSFFSAIPCRISSGLFVSASSSQKISRRSVSQSGEELVELHGSAAVRDRQDAALLRRLGGVGGHALDIDLRNLGVMRHHRLQHAGAHLDGLLHHVVEPAGFQRREAIDETGRLRLGAHLLGKLQRRLLPARLAQHRAPFAVAAVEDEEFRALGHAQHIQEVVRLRLVGGMTVSPAASGASMNSRCIL
jgi:hypothetical protein